jgi:hypothetical protein
VIKLAYLTGARPVVGTLGASGLMLLACSWFVLAPADLGGTRDVGAHPPVRIDGAMLEPRPAHRAVATIARARRTAPRLFGAAHEQVARPATAPHGARTREPVPASSQPPSAGPAAQPPAAARSPLPTPAPAAASQQPAVTPTPPAPLGDLPQVTLPPVAISSPPDVASPDIDTKALPLELP